MTASSPFGFVRVKGVALAATDLDRARAFYAETLGLPPFHVGGELMGYVLGGTVFMPKSDWYGSPTEEPNFRITLEVEDARRAEAAFRERGVRIADPVEQHGESFFGSFLDSEGNKIWFCS